MTGRRHTAVLPQNPATPQPAATHPVSEGCTPSPSTGRWSGPFVVQPERRHRDASVWHSAEVQQWVYDGTSYRMNSMYALPENAWTYELSGPSSSYGTVAVVVPDTTPDDGPFTPMDASHARVTAGDGELPWPLMLRFIRYVEASGDIVARTTTPSVTGDLALSLNYWRFAGRAFEVTSYHDSEHGSWRYELYEADPANTANEYVDVGIPDLQPHSGPFMPAPGEQIVFASHGSPVLPWPVFRHFLDAISASDDIG